MRVAALVVPYNGCSFYRILLPLEYMPWNKEDQVKLFYPEGTYIRPEDVYLAGQVTELESFEPDIIFCNASLQYRRLDWLKAQKKKGTKLIIDIDDFWEIGSQHPLYERWYQENSNVQVLNLIKEADVILCATENLRKKVIQQTQNKNIHVIPNAVPFGEPHYKKVANQKFINKTNFLYAGGSTHYQDILLLKNKFDKLGGDKWTKDNAIFTLAGFNPLKGNVHCQWDKMASIFKRTGSYQILDTLPIQEHMSFYDQADVVLIPLVHNEFNRCKSVLKIVEAATRELPCIVSSSEPYTELKEMPLMWDNWLANIKYCIKNPDAIKGMGKELARQMEEKFEISMWSHMRYSIFKLI